MVYKGDWNMRGVRTGLEEEGLLGREEENAIRKLYKMFTNEKGAKIGFFSSTRLNYYSKSSVTRTVMRTNARKFKV
jgi:hypothetical protein